MPLVNKGQSINHIFATHSDEIRLSKKTIYNYIDQSAFRVRNIDLPKKVRYKQRHSHEVLMKFDYQYRKGRTYTDFTSFMEQNPKLPIVEMDTVIGARNSGKVLLTILFRDTKFMLQTLLTQAFCHSPLLMKKIMIRLTKWTSFHFQTLKMQLKTTSLLYLKTLQRVKNISLILLTFQADKELCLFAADFLITLEK